MVRVSSTLREPKLSFEAIFIFKEELLENVAFVTVALFVPTFTLTPVTLPLIVPVEPVKLTVAVSLPVISEAK